MADHRLRVAALRRERMRHRLLESALQLVATVGPGELSIDAVIETARVSRGTFYKYFASPSELVQTVAQEVTGELLRAIDQIVIQRHDPAERLAVGIRQVLRIAKRYPIVGGFFVRLGWPLGWHGSDTGQSFFELVPRDLELGMAQGTFVPMHSSVPLNLIAGTVIGGIQSMLTETPPEDYGEQLVAAILRGLGVDKRKALKLAYADLEDATVASDSCLGRVLFVSRA
ncbi:MAG: TetR/AcrR family transcriptional regulator [Ferrovibrio sp.]|uniref:TetR/AcrR family transcriptional regulator n=1 Tax=Ferrovibrio sp. TaxID=1917215 RepID=UPI003919AB5E